MSTSLSTAIKVVVAAAGTGTVVATVVGFAMNFECNVKIGQCEQRVRAAESQAASTENASRVIERSLGNERYLDIEKLFSLDRVPGSVVGDYYADDHFVASSGKHWKHSLSTEYLIAMSMLVDKELALMEVFGDAAVGRAIPTHLWEGKQTYKIENHGLYKTLYPLISVKRLKFSDVPVKEFFEHSPILAQSLSALKSDDANIDKKLITEITAAFADDFLAFTLNSLTNGVAALSFKKNTRARLTKAQKVRNVLYAQTLVMLRDIVVNGRQVDEFYFIKEVFAIATRQDAFLIYTITPTYKPDFTTTEFQHVNEWFAHFKLTDDY